MWSFLKSSREADKLTKEFLCRQKYLLKELEGFSKDKSIVTLHTLRSLELNKWYYADDSKIKYKLIELTDSEAVFITVMEAGAKFAMHKHDGEERGVVVEGHLIDDINHLKLLKGEEFKYRENQYHEPYCTVKSIYEVTFIEN